MGKTHLLSITKKAYWRQIVRPAFYADHARYGMRTLTSRVCDLEEATSVSKLIGNRSSATVLIPNARTAYA